MGFQEQRVLEARLDLLDSLDPPELNQFNFQMDPSSLRALRARQVHQDQPDLEGVKGHWGIRDHPGGTDLLVLQANAVSKAETEYLEFRDLKDYQGGGGATYVRWGNTTCPPTAGTELVYAGRAVSSHWSSSGGTSDILCLPEEPE